jgi:hypothetical protein
MTTQTIYNRIFNLDTLPDNPLRQAIQRHQELADYHKASPIDPDELHKLNQNYRDSLVALGLHALTHALTSLEVSKESVALPEPEAPTPEPEAPTPEPAPPAPLPLSRDETLEHKSIKPPDEPEAPSISAPKLLGSIDPEILKRRMQSSSWGQKQTLENLDLSHYHALKHSLGDMIPTAVSSYQQAHDRLIDLINILDQHHRWKPLAMDSRRELVNAVVAMARHLADTPTRDSIEADFLDRDTKDVFRAIGRLKMATAEDFFYGMAKNHSPKHGDSWIDDARHLLDRVVVEPAPAASPTPKPHAPKKESHHEDEHDAPVEPAVNPLPLAKGQRWIMIGANPSETKRAHFEQLFELSDLEWVEVDKKSINRTNTVVQRMQNGTVDVVLIVGKFCSHKVSKKIRAAHKGTSSLLVELEGGYGDAQIISALQDRL